MNVLFATVVFPASEPYLHEFLTNVKCQDYHDFDVLIINDGINEGILSSILDGYKELDMTVLHNVSELSPSELRVKILSYAKELHYDLLIIGDSDDTFSFNRVSCIVDTFHRSRETFFYNTLVKNNGTDIFCDIPKKTDSFRDVAEYNYIGLSMVGIRMHDLSSKFIKTLNEYKGGVFDWYFVSRLLLDNKHGMFVKNAKTIYRIYPNNYIGIATRTKENIQKEIQIKRSLYSVLEKYSEYYKDLGKAYKNLENIEYNVKNLNHYWWGLTRRKKKSEI